MLESVEAERVDELWCLGDITGYGARPNECVALVRERATVCLAGNHDLVISGAIELDAFSADAAAAARWSQDALGDEARDYLRALAPAAERGGVSLYHGSIRDPIWEYVLSPDVAVACMLLQPTDVALIGHSHVALSLGLGDDGIYGGQAASGAVARLDNGRTLLNPGSVGQPRDRDPRAAWLLLDREAAVARFRRTEYDVERTQREIREAGLPSRLAERLALGM